MPQSRREWNNTFSWQPFVVEDVLSAATIEFVLHGSKRSAAATEAGKCRVRVRTSRMWPGALALARGGLYGGGCHPGIISCEPRQFGRRDYLLSPSLKEDLLSKDELMGLRKVCARLKEKVGANGEINEALHLMVCSPGSVDQDWHTDDDMQNFYYTMTLPITEPSRESGFTEFSDEAGVQPLPKQGQCLVFDGKTLHRGTANRTESPRVFLYMAFFTGTDGNTLAGSDRLYIEEEFVPQASVYCEDVGSVLQGDIVKVLGNDDTRHVAVVQVVGPFPMLSSARKLGLISHIGAKDIGRERFKTADSTWTSDVILSVSWLYTLDEVRRRQLSLGVPLSRGGQEFELFSSGHYDEISPTAMSQRVQVSFGLGGIPAKLTKGSYYSYRSFDHTKGKVVANKDVPRVFAEDVAWDAFIALYAHMNERAERLCTSLSQRKVGRTGKADKTGRSKRWRGR